MTIYMYVDRKNIEIQPGLEPGSSEFPRQMLLPLSYWSSGIGAEDMMLLSIDTIQFPTGSHFWGCFNMQMERPKTRSSWELNRVYG